MTSVHSNTTTLSADPLPPGRIRVDHMAGDAFAVGVRRHRLVVDQPVEAGGGDHGPTPTELFAASLASCVAFYAGRYLKRHQLDPAGLQVEAEFTMADDRPARVSGVQLTVTVAGESGAGAAGGAVGGRVPLHGAQHTAPAPRGRHHAGTRQGDGPRGDEVVEVRSAFPAVIQSVGRQGD